MIAEFLINFAREFLSLTLIVLPYFALGVIIGAVLDRFLNPELTNKYLGKGLRSVVSASVLGAILPGCSCATVPMAEGLKRSGASLATVAAFILVSPLLSPHTLILNYGLLGWEFTLARVIFSLGAAILFGIIVMGLESRGIDGFTVPRNSELGRAACVCEYKCGCDSNPKSFWRSLWKIFRNLGKYFLLGMFLAALLTTLVPEDAISRFIGSSGPFAYLAAAVVGIPLYVCEGEEIPITLSLLRLGLGTGPAMAFLLGSVGTCIPTLAMAPKILGRRLTILYLLFWFVFAITSGIIFQAIFPRFIK